MLLLLLLLLILSSGEAKAAVVLFTLLAVGWTNFVVVHLLGCGLVKIALSISSIVKELNALGCRLDKFPTCQSAPL
jgi:hypothetical protein